LKSKSNRIRFKKTTKEKKEKKRNWKEIRMKENMTWKINQQ